MPPAQDPSTPTPPPPQPVKRQSITNVMRRANSVSGLIVLLVAVILLGTGIGYLISSSRQKATKSPQVSTLSESQLKELSNIGNNLGSSNQVLTIGASSVFRGAVAVGGDLSVTGRFNANGAVTLSQLNITGSTAVTGLNVGSNLTVAGTTTLQNGLTVQNLLAVNGGINVSGTASVNALNASSISTHTINISGPLTIGHLVTQGTTPTIVAGAVGAGGTVSISGNDTAGTININTASGAAASTLATITFRAAFGGTPHVTLTPLTAQAATTLIYVTRSATGFAIHAAATPTLGPLAFDYIVAQ